MNFETGKDIISRYRMLNSTQDTDLFTEDRCYNEYFVKIHAFHFSSMERNCFFIFFSSHKIFMSSLRVPLDLKFNFVSRTVLLIHRTRHNWNIFGK